MTTAPVSAPRCGGVAPPAHVQRATGHRQSRAKHMSKPIRSPVTVITYLQSDPGMRRGPMHRVTIARYAIFQELEQSTADRPGGDRHQLRASEINGRPATNRAAGHHLGLITF
jgi:hypothetical protein